MITRCTPALHKAASNTTRPSQAEINEFNAGLHELSLLSRNPEFTQLVAARPRVRVAMAEALSDLTTTVMDAGRASALLMNTEGLNRRRKRNKLSAERELRTTVLAYQLLVLYARIIRPHHRIGSDHLDWHDIDGDGIDRITM